MSPLWITISIHRGCDWHYLLKTHFEQPSRTGTKRECNYDWYSSGYTYNEYKKTSEFPIAISDMIKEASVSYSESFDVLQHQFIMGEIALKISEQGVTVYKPYDKRKNTMSELNKESFKETFETALCTEMSMISDTPPADPNVFTAVIKSLI